MDSVKITTSTSKTAIRQRHSHVTNLRKRAIPWLFMLPALLVFLMFVFLPIVATFCLSFSDYNGLDVPRFVGFLEYQKLFSSSVFWLSMVNSFLLTVGVVITLTILPIPVAYILQRNVRGLGWIRAIYYVPVITPIVVAAVAWKWLLTQDGLFNYILMSLHILKHPIDWLGNPHYSLLGVLLVVFWRAFGFYLIIYLAGLVAIPTDIYEAASIDGANAFQTFFRVAVPLLKGTISLVVIVAFVAAMKIFDEIYVMTQGGPANATNTTAYYIYDEAFSYNHFGYASAIAVVLLVIVLTVTMLILKLFEKDEVEY